MTDTTEEMRKFIGSNNCSHNSQHYKNYACEIPRRLGRVLKTSRENLKGKVQRRQYLLAVGLSHYSASRAISPRTKLFTRKLHAVLIREQESHFTTVARTQLVIRKLTTLLSDIN